MATSPVAIAHERLGRGRAGDDALALRRKKPLGAPAVSHGRHRRDRALRRRSGHPRSDRDRRGEHALARPSPAHWLGTDNLGRDIYSRIVHGARVSLVVGVASTLLGSVLGGVIGLLSGYAGGKVDLVTQRVLDILQGLPLLVLALVMSAALGPSLTNVVIAISVPIIPRAARVIRSSVLVDPRDAVRRGRARARAPAPPHRVPPHPAQHDGAVHRALHRAARERDPGRGGALVPRPRRAGAVPLVGAHALGLGGGVRAEGAATSCLSRASRSASPSSARISSATRSATRSTRASAARRILNVGSHS